MSQDQRLSKRAQRKLDNKEMNAKGPTTKFYLMVVGSIVFCLVALSQFFFLLGGMMKPVGVEFIQPAEENFQKALTTGEPYVVYCTSDATEEQPVPRIVVDIQKAVTKNSDASDTKFVSVNCFKPMGEGKKTLAETYNFGKNEGFLGIFANQEKPKQLNWLQNADSVAKQIFPMVQPTMQRVTYLRDFQPCRDRKSCLILSSTKRDELSNLELQMKPYVKSFRGVKMAVVDTDFYNLQMDEEFLQKGMTPLEEKKEGEEEEPKQVLQTGGICIVKTDEARAAIGVNGTENYVPEVPAKWIAAHMPAMEDGLPSADFLDLCQRGGDAAEWFKLSMVPDIKAKPTEPKVVSAGSRDGKWQKERVGRRAEEEEFAELDDDLDEPPQGEEEEIEDVDM